MWGSLGARMSVDVSPHPPVRQRALPLSHHSLLVTTFVARRAVILRPAKNLALPALGNLRFQV
jgi:hypothetical protein